MAPSTYGKTWWREGYACGCMIQSIEDIIEPRLRDAGYLGATETVNIFQQAYSSGVEASAGTHGGGGALDHQKGSDGETKIWRECGVADWQRGTPEDNAFDDHNHGIWQGCPHLSGDAEGQIDQYESGCDGLAGWGPDDSPNVPPITWQKAYDKYKGAGGIFGMTNCDKWDRNKDQTVPKDDEWHVLKINDEDDYSLATGPVTFLVTVGVELVGLAVGQTAQIRLARVLDYSGDKETTVESWYPITEILGTTGNAYGGLTFANNIGGEENGGKQKIRLYGKSPDAQITVADICARTLH